MTRIARPLNRLGWIMLCASSCAVNYKSWEQRCSDSAQHLCDQIQAAVNAADNACQVDTDCVYTTPHPKCCIPGCYSRGVSTSDTGAAKLEKAIADISAANCNSLDCTCGPFVPPMICCPPDSGPPPVACVNNQCALPPIEEWISFAVIRNFTSGGEIVSPEGTFPNCGTSNECTAWYVGFAHSVTIRDAGQDAGARTFAVTALSDSDYAALDSILRSLSFRRSELDGLGCTPHEGDIQVEFAIQRVSTITTFAVSGCLLNDVAGSDVRRLFEIVTKY